MKAIVPSKKDVTLALLERSTVFIHLDPRREGVVVPPWFKKQPHLVLQIGLNMAIPIRDLEVDDEAVSGTLSFNRSPYYCRIPWHAVFVLVGEDQQGLIWPDDIPPELRRGLLQQKVSSVGSTERPERSARPHLRPVSPTGESRCTQAPETREMEGPAPAGEPTNGSVSGGEPAQAERQQPEGKQKKRPSHLRVIK